MKIKLKKLLTEKINILLTIDVKKINSMTQEKKAS